VELSEAFELCKLLKYRVSLGIKVPRDLNSKMKMKGIMTRRDKKTGETHRVHASESEATSSRK
jgi:hypothetical protein